MRTDNAKAIHLTDYRPSDFLISTVRLEVQLHLTRTLVRSILQIKRNPLGVPDAPLVLIGGDLVFHGASLDGRPLRENETAVTPNSFELLTPAPDSFTLEIETEINPQANTQLEGLFRTSKTYCTQCEAQGFRRITYFLDRPDVLAVYTLRIEADKAEAPILLGNGNCLESGELSGGRHFAVWHDPFPKPSYLFALVAGDLAQVEDHFITRSGRDVTLRIFVEHGNEGRCAYAMDSLKRSMKWDEEAFGCEYDLDIFMIVAVSDFNMGAMENKGLNVFNDKYILVLPDTATDIDYANVEGIVAHEYFHNWTGNRITCRDWFQLCLKEGLTVYRDQEFSADMRSRAVKRIEDVRDLKGRQFPEDAGPLAHPVRPESYHEINNFYTATIYEKGAEVIRALRTLIGTEAFRKGTDLYLSRHDGEAATVEDFIACFAETSGQDLTQFFLWYRQAGTPQVNVTIAYDERAQSLTLTAKQSLAPTPGQSDKMPMVIPLSIGLIGSNGHEMVATLPDGTPFSGVFVLDEAEAALHLSGLSLRPVVSLNRGFNAPVQITANQPDADLAFLAANDTDPFNRWQAAQTLVMAHLLRLVRGEASDESPVLSVYAQALDKAGDDQALAAQLLIVPSVDDIAGEIGTNIDHAQIHAVVKAFKLRVANTLRPALLQLYPKLAGQGAFSPDAKEAGRRALRSVVLSLLCQGGDVEGLGLAQTLYATADNMTDCMAALSALVHNGPGAREAALTDFSRRYAGDPLIMDKWISLQATIAEDATLDRVKELMKHPHFSLTNPNRLRALISAFAMSNPTQFNRADGAGYALIADIILTVDPINAQVAARMVTAFRAWTKLESGRRAKAEAELRRVSQANLSSDARDMVERTLGR